MFYKGAMGQRSFAALVFGMAISGVTASAGAQQAPAPHVTSADLAAAKRHYAEGERKLHADKYEEALAEFKAANDIKTTPQAEKNIGVCEDKLGHYVEAVEWYEKFLAHVPAKLAATGDEIQKRTDEIKAISGKVHFETDPNGATVTVDDKPEPGVTPIDVDLAPGHHDVKFTEEGRLPGERSVDVTFASTQTVTQQLSPEPPPPPPPPIAAAPPPPPPPLPVSPPPAEPRSLVPAHVTGGLAIAAAGVGTVFGVLALNDKAEFDRNPTTSTADNGDTHSLISDMAFGIAVTFGVTSAVLYFTKDEPAATSTSKGNHPVRVAKRDALTVTPVPLVGPHLGGGGFALRF